MIYPRFLGSRGARLASSTLLLGALLAIAPFPAQASADEGPCVDDGGVTVVVDFTDLGGDIVARCASVDPDTGRAALEAAGFTATDSQPGMICAIDAAPDPCPATFEGSFWSYWHGAAEGDWIAYQVGADSSDPLAGEIEGWRYNDGSTGPGIAPADVLVTDVAATDGAATGVAATDAAPAEVTVTASAPAPASDSADQLVVLTTIGVAALIAVLVSVFLVRSRNRRASEED